MLKGEVIVDGSTLVFLAASFLSLSLSSLISSSMGEKVERSSLLLEVAELRLASKWLRMSSSLFRPSRSKTLWDGLRASSVCSISHNFIGASGLVGRLEAVLFWVWDVCILSCFLLVIVAEREDSAYDRVTCCEFVRCVEVALPRVVALTTCCSTRNPSAAVQPLVVGGAGGTATLSRNCLMVWTAWFVSSTISSRWACRLTIWARSTSISPATFSFLGIWGGFEAWGWFCLIDGWFCTGSGNRFF